MNYGRIVTRCFFAATVALCLWTSPQPASADVLIDTLTDGVLNTYEDQSRESFVDIDGSGSVSNGDVLLLFQRVDNKTVPNAVAIGPTELYIFATQEIANFTATPGAGTTSYDWDLAPVSTAPAGYGFYPEEYDARLADAALQGNTGVVGGVYEAVGTNLITTFTGAGEFVGADESIANGGSQGDIRDLIQTVADGDLDYVAGFGAGPTEVDDFFSASTPELAPVVDAIADLTVTTVATLSGTAPFGTFDGGLTELAEGTAIFPPAAGVPLFELVPFTDLGSGLTTFHELTITGGDITGAADIAYAGVDGSAAGNGLVPGEAASGILGAANTNPLFFTIDDPTANLILNAFGTSNNADFSLFPGEIVIINGGPIPEPATCAMAITGLLMLVFCRWRRRRS